MFAIEISGPDDYRESLTVGWDEYNIGRAGHNELVLDHPSVGMRHLCVFHRPPDKLAVFAFHTDHGTWVDGEVINSERRRLQHGSRVRIGEYELVFTFVAAEALPATPVETEAELIAAVERREPEARNVYADWLEGNGQTARAEYLRIEQALVALPRSEAIDIRIRRDNYESRLRELATVIDLAWRVRLACPRVMACNNGTCTQHWGLLDAITESPRVRVCGICEQKVAYCADADDCRAIWRIRARMVQDVLCPASYGLY